MVTFHDHIASAGRDDDAVTALALAARDGSPRALEEFVRATRPEVWRFVASRTDPSAAEDLAQETFARALRGLDRFAARSPVRSWLLAIARRVVADHHRARARAAGRTHDGLADRRAVRAADAAAPGVEEACALSLLVQGLRPERRTAFLLTRVAGYSYVEVSALTGSPVGTVRSRVARARRELSGALRPA